MKNVKQPVTCEVYINGKLHRVLYENRVIYTDSKGRFVRDEHRCKRYLGKNKTTYRIDYKQITAVKGSELLNSLTR